MPSNITGIFALHTPHFAKQQTCWFACFYTKIFYATKVPKSFKIFGTKPTFLLLNGTLSMNFIRFKRSSITFDFFNNSPPSPEIFSCTGFFVFFYISSWILFTTFKTNYLVMECLTSTGFFNPVESFWRSPFFLPSTRVSQLRTSNVALCTRHSLDFCNFEGGSMTVSRNTTLSLRNIFHLTCARVILHPSNEAEHLLKE